MQSGKDPDLSLPCPVCTSLFVLFFQGSSFDLFFQETPMLRAPVYMLAVVPLGGACGTLFVAPYHKLSTLYFSLSIQVHPFPTPPPDCERREGFSF